MRGLYRLIGLLSLSLSFGAAAQTPPACKAAETFAGWSRTAQNGFAIDVPTGSTFARPPLSLDFESGTWSWADGRTVRYQFGFDVDGLEGLADDRDTVLCTVQRDGREIVYYAFRNQAGQYGWGFHLSGLRSYYPSTGELQDGLTVVGFGATELAHREGLAVLSSFELSRVPEAVAGVYETAGAAAQGIAVHVAGGIASVVWGTYAPSTGEQFWLTGVGERGDVAYHGLGGDGGEVRYVAVPLTFYRSASGKFPGRRGVNPELRVWGYGEMRFRDDCSSGELDFRSEDGTVSGVLPITRVTARVGTCSRFD